MIRALVTDIEGTTSSISFVKEVLFPYAREHLPSFIASHANDAAVKHWLQATAQLADLSEADDEGIVQVLLQWIDEDRKATPLKALQGMIWADGYRSGAYRAHLYPEVAARLQHWHARGIPLYVYSSGSVAAQKLFFGFSEAGDLSGLFSGYFDTEIGGKREASSYSQICTTIGVAADEILFLSDIVEELDAARSAGLQTTWLCREPLTCPADARHACVNTFDAITV